VTPLEVAAIVVMGLAAGGLAGMFGVGGGLLLVPAMVVFLAVDQHVAQGTSLMVIVPTATLGAYRHWRTGFVDLRAAAILGLGGMVGAIVGTQAALVLDSATLRWLFIIYLAIMGIRIAAPPGLWGRGRRQSEPEDPEVDPWEERAAEGE